MSDLRQFAAAVEEAFAPALRDAVYGREIPPEEELAAELEYQLESRGIEVTEEHD